MGARWRTRGGDEIACAVENGYIRAMRVSGNPVKLRDWRATVWETYSTSVIGNPGHQPSADDPKSDYLPLSVVSTVYLAFRYPDIPRQDLFITVGGPHTACCPRPWQTARQ